MNEILQKRIDEAAKIYAESEVNRIDVSTYSMHEKKRLKMFDGYDIEEALTNFSEQILQNQWISVEEALPQKDDLYFVLINSTHPRVTEFENGKWQGYDNITHWTPIPELKGGEK